MNVSYTVSLGRLCCTSQELKDMGLKKFSCPFDWTHSTADIILDCLSNNFTVLLDKEQIFGVSTTGSGHYMYDNNGNRFFNHHNLEHNDDHYKYFVRCVDRFNKVLQSDKRKLFITTDITTLHDSNATIDKDKDKYIAINNMLSKLTTNYTYIVVYTKVTGESKIDTIYNDNNLKVYLQNIIQYNNGIHFTLGTDRDLYRSIINQYEHEPVTI